LIYTYRSIAWTGAFTVQGQGTEAFRVFETGEWRGSVGKNNEDARGFAFEILDAEPSDIPRSARLTPVMLALIIRVLWKRSER